MKKLVIIFLFLALMFSCGIIESDEKYSGTFTIENGTERTVVIKRSLEEDGLVLTKSLSPDQTIEGRNIETSVPFF